MKAAGTGTTVLRSALDNTGLVQVQEGTLSVQGGGVVGGSYLVDAGASLTFGTDNVTTTSVALPADFTAGPLSWTGTFTGSAQDNSGSGLASVGVSLFDGNDYYNGTAFGSATPTYNGAALAGDAWTYAINTSIFTADLPYGVGSEAKDKDGGSEPSTIKSLLLAPAPPTVTAIAPATGLVAGGTEVTITGRALANAVKVDFGATAATIVSDTNTTIVAISPLVNAAAAVVDVTVTTAGGTSVTSAVDKFTYFVAPTITMTEPTNGTATSSNQPTLAATATEAPGGTGLANVQFEYSSNGGTTWNDAGAAEPSAPFTFTFASALPDGNYEARAIATDNGGHSTTSSAVSFTVDAVISPPPPPTPPSVISARLLDVTVVTGKGKHQKKTAKFAGFTLVFNEALNPSSARMEATTHCSSSPRRARRRSANPWVSPFRTAHRLTQ